MKNHSSNMTDAAIAALREHGFSRRQFLKGSGALVVAFGVGEFADRLGISPEKMLAQGGNTPQALDSWIAIGADGNVTVYTGRADMGQGTYTVQYQLAAEELSVPISRIRLVECDTAMTPDQGTSSGSQAHPVNFNHENLAQACATAREALVAMAATKLGVPATDLNVVDGVVTHKSDAAKKVSYGELLGSRSRTGRCLADRCRASTCRRWPPAASSTRTTCVCPGWCMAAWSVRRQSARRSRAWTKAPSPACRAT